MTDKNTHIALASSHIAALALLADGLCRIRESAFDSPAHAAHMADVLHNIPGILAGEDRAGEAYLLQLLEEGRRLMDDQAWRASRSK